MDEVEMRFTLVRDLMPALGYDAPMVIDMADKLVKFAQRGTDADQEAQRLSREAYNQGVESGKWQARHEMERAAKANAGLKADAA